MSRCRPITPASAPFPTRSAPRFSMAPSPRFRSRRRRARRKHPRSTSTPRAKMTRFLVGLWLAVLVAVSPAYAQTFPKLSGRGVDQAGLLTAAQIVDLGSKSEALEQRTGRQFVVATVNSLEGRTIEDYGYRLGRAWGIGNEQKDDGVILLVAPKERKVRIETGYGARGFLTDAVSSVIIRQGIGPRFKAGDYGGGITAGADRIIETMALPPAEAAKRAQEIGAQEARRSEQRVNPF